MPYPQIIIFNKEMEVVHQPSEVDDFLYGISENEQTQVKVLEKNGQYHTLSGVTCQALTATELAQVVKHYLINQGQCCVSKIDQLTTQQAFNLLTLNQCFYMSDGAAAKG